MKAATLTVLAMLGAVPMIGIAAHPAEGNSDHQQMLAKLKVTPPLRPCPVGRLNADGTVPPSCANCDESKTAAGSPVPPLLVMNDGRRITALTMWEAHRKELFEIFNRGSKLASRKRRGLERFVVLPQETVCIDRRERPTFWQS